MAGCNSQKFTIKAVVECIEPSGTKDTCCIAKASAFNNCSVATIHFFMVTAPNITFYAYTHTHCAEYIPYSMSLGGCPLTCGSAAVEGAMYSCLGPLPDTPAHMDTERVK